MRNSGSSQSQSQSQSGFQWQSQTGGLQGTQPQIGPKTQEPIRTNNNVYGSNMIEIKCEPKNINPNTRTNIQKIFGSATQNPTQANNTISPKFIPFTNIKPQYCIVQKDSIQMNNIKSGEKQIITNEKYSLKTEELINAVFTNYEKKAEKLFNKYERIPSLTLIEIIQNLKKDLLKQLK